MIGIQTRLSHKARNLTASLQHFLGSGGKHPGMQSNRTHSRFLKSKILGIVVGAAAAIALMVVGVLNGVDGLTPGRTLAGSGDAPTSTVYVQPTVAGMSMGATATPVTPSSVPATTEAVPPIKAGQ